MQFDILSYLAQVTSRLERMSDRPRVLFALWCCEPLLEQFGTYLSRQAGSDTVMALVGGVERLWVCLSTSAAIDVSEMGRMKETCLSVNWEEEDVQEGDESRNYGAIELLGCLRRAFECAESRSSRAAAECAERVLNWIDNELAMICGIEDPLAHPRIRGELDAQYKMLEFLEGPEAQIDGHTRRLFRP